MKLVRGTLFALISCAGLFGEAPEPNDLSIEGLEYKGTGCRPGSVASQLSADGKAFTLLFDDFTVDTTNISEKESNNHDRDHDRNKDHGNGHSQDEHEKPAQKGCNIKLMLRAPVGYSFAIFYVDYRGFVNLENNARGIQRSHYHFGGRESEVGKFEIVGPKQDDYFNRTVTSIRSNEWSSCNGRVRNLNLRTSIQVRGRGVMTVDSTDGSIAHEYGITWKKCEAPIPNQPTPPAPRPHIRSVQIPGQGFDGDVDLCLNVKNGVLSASQVPGSQLAGGVNYTAIVQTVTGALPPVALMGAMPGSVQLGGDWSKVKNAVPIVTRWKRAEKGIPPAFSSFQKGDLHCLRMIDGPGGRPGAVANSIVWRIRR